MKKFFLLIILFSCAKVKQENKPIVLVSVPPYVFFVEKIAKDLVEAKSLVPVKSDPHHFEPTPKELDNASKAILWLKIGEPFEKFLIQFFKGIYTVDLRENIELIHVNAQEDRHIWLSPKLARIQAKTIFQSLVKILPQHEEFFKKNLMVFLNELEDLDKNIQNKLKAFKEKSFLISHPAYAYFCKDYDIEQIFVEDISKTSLQKIKQVYETVQKRNIKKAFIEMQHDNRGVQLIANKLLLPLRVVDPYSPDYYNNLINFTDILIQ